ALAQWNNARRPGYLVFLFGAALIGALSAYRLRAGTFHGRTDKLICWAAALLPCYVAIQCIPLPEVALQILSPARAELLSALAPVIAPSGWAPLTVSIAQTSIHFSLVSAYTLIFFAGWVSGFELRDRPWLAIAPVLAAAVIQSLFGLSQV